MYVYDWVFNFDAFNYYLKNNYYLKKNKNPNDIYILIRSITSNELCKLKLQTKLSLCFSGRGTLILSVILILSKRLSDPVRQGL